MTHFDINLSIYQANRLQIFLLKDLKSFLNCLTEIKKNLQINYSVNPIFQTVNFSPKLIFEIF